MSLTLSLSLGSQSPRDLKGLRWGLSVKGLKGWGVILISMESIAEVVIVSEKRVCTSCKVSKGEGFFVKCRCGPGVFFKTCKTCRDCKAKYREKVKARKDDAATSASTAPIDYYEMVFSHPPARG